MQIIDIKPIKLPKHIKIKVFDEIIGISKNKKYDIFCSFLIHYKKDDDVNNNSTDFTLLLGIINNKKRLVFVSLENNYKIYSN